MRLRALDARARAFWSNRGELARRWLAALVIGMLLTWLVWQVVSRPTVLTVAVGPPTSERVNFLRTVSERLRQGRKSIRLRVVPVKDSAEAARLLDNDTVQLAVLRSDQPDVADARSFAVLDRRAVLMFAAAAPAKSKGATPSKTHAKGADDGEDGEATVAKGPLSPAHLIGRRIVVASDGFGANRTTVARLLAHSGLAAGSMTLTELPSRDIAPALASHRADVAVVIADPTSRATRALVADIVNALGGAVAVGPPPAPEALVAIHRALALTELPAGVLGGASILPTQKLPTVAITEELVGDSDIEEATGAQLTKALLEVRGRLTALVDTSFEIEAPPLDTLRRFMPHAGVSAHINERSTTFLEKYSDQIWLGLFALGLIGSSIAGLAGRLGLVGGSAPVDPLPGEVERLLGAIAAASSPAEVDAIRRDLRTLAAARLRQAIASGLDASEADHPSQWFPLIDALAASRRDELTAQPEPRQSIRASN
ncbi:MAG: hypothetical protein R3D27_01640 [Hyphomicrobiaceae bacterium]